MNPKIKQLIGNQFHKLKIAHRSITWAELAKDGYEKTVKLAKASLQTTLANAQVQITENTSVEGLRLEAYQYVFSTKQLEDIVEEAFSMGAESTAKPIGPGNQTSGDLWYVNGNIK